MIIVAAFLAGCAIGWMRARRRGGTAADKVQFALAHGIPAALAGLLFVIFTVSYGAP